MAEKKSGLVEKGPGDVKEMPKVPSFRGDSGDSSAKGSDAKDSE